LNLRDVGGHVTDDGRRVATGLAYRSAEVVPPDDATRQALADLGLRYIYDLRTETERDGEPDQLPPGAELVVLDVFGNAPQLAPAQLKTLFDDPAAATKALGDGKLVAAFEDAYRKLVSLPSARAAYHQLFTDLADEATGPALFHCTAGKDRTGWATAVLLLVLGVPQDAVTADFVAGNPVTRRLFQPQMDEFTAAGGDGTLLLPLFEVEESYLAAALDEVKATYGTLGEYVQQGLGLDAAAEESLRQRFLP
jgi:protein-tyrosine phosphatase